MFVDCVVVAGSNPSVMLIKELIESEQLTGHKANFALSALGYYVKTPTRELLYELVVGFFVHVFLFVIQFDIILLSIISFFSSRIY